MARGFNYAPGASDDVSRAADPALTRESVTELCSSKNAVVRETLARRSDLTLGQSVMLTHDSAADVRAALGANTAVGGTILEHLSEDRHRAVVLAVACNPRTPLPVLERLALHKRADVRDAAATTLERVLAAVEAVDAPVAPDAQVVPIHTVVAEPAPRVGSESGAAQPPTPEPMTLPFSAHG
ncbi:hypothetical protein [Demequina capsici]|uniref:Leucine rich repeat variant n=1 Tax=Demequina capsici TaxID=3075620 RepID=A0AA96F975_9MICO|nr:hypothetical protein [Demequina sp. OYTSA14]WNM24035.1 hypothetical protein RN606_11795 [Demequina sp. OYTSA14]